MRYSDLHSRALLALTLLWGLVVAPVCHEFYHAQEWRENVAIHAGHVHDHGHAVDATRTAKLDHIVCVVQAAGNYAHRKTQDAFRPLVKRLFFAPDGRAWVGNSSECTPEIRGPPVA